MTTASRTFQRQVADKKKGAPTRPTAEFILTWLDPDDESKTIKTDTFHATQPTDEKLFLLAAMTGDEDASAAADAAATLQLFRESLPEKEYATLRARLKDDEDPAVTLEVLSEVVPWLMGEWTGFPTEPSSGSSASPATTGTRSTGRVRGPGSTRSTTASPAS
jgi:hypothetical protein